MALVIKKMVDYYFYLNDEISGEPKIIYYIWFVVAIICDVCTDSIRAE